MAIRTDREDTSQQETALADARKALQEALNNLAAEAKDAAKACGSKRSNPDIPAVHAAWLATDRAREAVEMAAIDLEGARGEDL